MAENVQDRLARAMGYELVHPERPNWRKKGDKNGRWVLHPVPSPDSLEAPGFAMKVLKDAGWEWTKSYNGYFAHDCRETRHMGPFITGNDALDLLELACRCLESKKEDAK